MANLGCFDPATQVEAGAGRTDCPGTIPDRYAAAGTLFVKTTGSTYGTLHVDGAATLGAGERLRATTLPALGAFTPTATTATGGDLWVQAASAFPESWLGVFVELKNSGGTVLGVFETVDRDASGRLKLGGAAAHAGAVASGRGWYRFDQVLTRGGAGFQNAELYGQPTLIAGNAAVDADLYGSDLSLAAGTTLRPGQRQPAVAPPSPATSSSAPAPPSRCRPIRPACRPGSPRRSTPAAATAAAATRSTGTLGAVFDSVYRPQLAGGAGNPYTLGDAPTAAAAACSRSTPPASCSTASCWPAAAASRAGAGGAGAGGTVRINAAELTGSGLIDASGGTLVSSDCSVQAGGGGGGRVALAVADLDDFAVDSQVRAWGGVTDCSGSPDRFAAAGTIYVATAASTYGRLLVDGGANWKARRASRSAPSCPPSAKALRPA